MPLRPSGAQRGTVYEAVPLVETPKDPPMVPTATSVGTMLPPQVCADPTQTPALHESTLQAFPSSQRLPSGKPVHALDPEPTFRHSAAVAWLGGQSTCETCSCKHSHRLPLCVTSLPTT